MAIRNLPSRPERTVLTVHKTDALAVQLDISSEIAQRLREMGFREVVIELTLNAS